MGYECIRYNARNCIAMKSEDKNEQPSCSSQATRVPPPVPARTFRAQNASAETKNPSKNCKKRREKNLPKDTERSDIMKTSNANQLRGNAETVSTKNRPQTRRLRPPPRESTPKSEQFVDCSEFRVVFTNRPSRGHPDKQANEDHTRSVSGGGTGRATSLMEPTTEEDDHEPDVASRVGPPRGLAARNCARRCKQIYQKEDCTTSLNLNSVLNRNISSNSSSRHYILIKHRRQPHSRVAVTKPKRVAPAGFGGANVGRSLGTGAGIGVPQSGGHGSALDEVGPAPRERNTSDSRKMAEKPTAKERPPQKPILRINEPIHGQNTCLGKYFFFWNIPISSENKMEDDSIDEPTPKSQSVCRRRRLRRRDAACMGKFGQWFVILAMFCVVIASVMIVAFVNK
ncbi:hypothetical protein EVAR_92932_1 [Eumeta japonica]|uniref:Uncharacterized protein n=1 Tax=Eumeta variegata TaxID=151549 RepID=A0A4C1TDF5_EUMVA|nr:hypothetical protein EVAR_92932_1 [Eumeta japonica]